jgi:hypothetical protein
MWHLSSLSMSVAATETDTAHTRLFVFGVSIPTGGQLDHHRRIRRR